jgi:hypothetical protein
LLPFPILLCSLPGDGAGDVPGACGCTVVCCRIHCTSITDEGSYVTDPQLLMATGRADE